MKRPTQGKGKAPLGPSQRQLRAGELVRHALVEILRETDVHDEALAGVSVTVTEARMSPDLKHAIVFVRPLGGQQAPAVVDALNRHSRFLRGELGRHVELKFTPDLRFRADESFEAAAHMDALFNSPQVRRDLEAGDEDADGPA